MSRYSKQSSNLEEFHAKFFLRWKIRLNILKIISGQINNKHLKIILHLPRLKVMSVILVVHITLLFVTCKLCECVPEIEEGRGLARSSDVVKYSPQLHFIWDLHYFQAQQKQFSSCDGFCGQPVGGTLY